MNNPAPVIVWYVIIVIAATWVIARIEGRSVFSYGFEATRKLSRLLGGAGLGFESISVLVGVPRTSSPEKFFSLSVTITDFVELLITSVSRR